METINVAIWRELAAQFLITFTVLSTIGLGVCAVGGGWSYLRQRRRATCAPSSAQAPAFGKSLPWARQADAAPGPLWDRRAVVAPRFRGHAVPATAPELCGSRPRGTPGSRQGGKHPDPRGKDIRA